MAGYVGVPAAPSTAGGPTVIRLDERIALRSPALETYHDDAETYFSSPTASVHLHLMGRQQICPLHRHRETSEATVIVSGVAEVRHVFGADEGLQTRTAEYRTGDLISSPVGCGHEWRNPSSERPLGNLVFASPLFEGNLYVRADDDALRAGPPPTLIDPDETLSRLSAGGEAVHAAPLGPLGDKLTLLFLREETTIPLDAGEGFVLYLARGSGAAEIQGRHLLGANELLVVPTGHLREASDLRFVAREGPVLAYLFRPDRGRSPGE